MRVLTEEDGRAKAHILPYIGGAEINTSPRQQNHRFILNLNDLTEAQVRSMPGIIAMLEEQGMPERRSGRLANIPFWQYERSRPEQVAAPTPTHARALTRLGHSLPRAEPAAFLEG